MDPETSWSDWSRERELARKEAHDKWLNEVIGTRRSFPWGSVSSDFDAKTGGSEITIEYGEDC